MCTFKVVNACTHNKQIFLAEHKSTGKLLAIKVFRKKTVIKDGEADLMFIEKRILLLAASVQHPFLTALHSCFQTKV